MHRLPYLAMVSFVLLLGLSSCGGSGSSSDDTSTPPPSTAVRQVDLDPGDERCPYGGVLVQTGIDENRNGKLDDDEVDASEAVCNGTPGTPGNDGAAALLPLLKRTVLPAGDTNCPAGGEFVESGIDANGNGMLETEEVDDSAYLCSSPASLFKRTALSAGDANCPAGGDFIESGIDDNSNSILETSEVDDSAYLCHSLSLLYAETEQPLALRSEVCPLGGTEGYFGIDTNGNGTLEADEINVSIPADCNTEVGLVLDDGDTPWSARFGHSSVAFDGKLWMLGGYNGDNALGDAWSSTDGVTWEEVTSSATRWSARSGHSSVAFDGKLWMLGGYDGSKRLDDVWSSTDGVTWEEVTSSATRWSARSSHSSVVFDGKLWVLGGFDGSYNNDVWSSADGASWTQVTISDTSWSARREHSSVVFNNRMWVIGGYRYAGSAVYLNDVWSSADGASWTQVTTAAGWSARHGHSSVVFDGKLWMLGGLDVSNLLDDVWSSSDGASWSKETTSDTRWPARSRHDSAVFDDYIWVLGGSDGDISSNRNDVWVYAP